VDPNVESAHPPPHFVLGSIPSYLLVPVLQLYRQGSADQQAIPFPCHCKLVLSIPSVEEDDPTVTLEARWFVDYDPLTRLKAPVLTERLDGNFNTSETVRPLRQPLDFETDALTITNGVHVVEVVLAEAAAFDSASTTRPNRAIREGYTSAEHTFVVNVKVDPDSARPRCPDVLPSVRVCQ